MAVAKRKQAKNALPREGKRRRREDSQRKISAKLFFTLRNSVLILNPIMKTQNEVLKDLKTQIEYQKKYVEEVFYYQGEDQLTAKISEDKWSIAQCFEHMNLSNHHYIAEIQKALPKLKSTENELKYKAGLIGSYMIKNMRPKNGQITNKMKTFKSVKPLAERQIGAIVKAQPVFADFYSDLNAFKKIIIALEGKNIQSAKVKSLAGSALRFKVGDALLLMLAHNDRHILQAVNTLKNK